MPSMLLWTRPCSDAGSSRGGNGTGGNVEQMSEPAVGRSTRAEANVRCLRRNFHQKPAC